jgi:hypothetical protein
LRQKFHEISGSGPANCLEHNPFQLADNPMRLSEVFLASGRQLAPEYAPMAWIGFSGKKPVAA